MTQYYVANSGLDTLDGLTEFTPWQTIAKVSGFASYNTGGDIVHGQRTSAWREQLTWPKAGASAANPNIIAAYGVGARPKLSGGDPQTGWSPTTPTDTYSKNIGATGPSVVLLTRADGSKQVLTANLVSQASLTDYQFFYSNPNLFIRVPGGNPDSVGATIEVNGARSYCFLASNKDYVVLDGWHGELSNLQGLYFNGGSLGSVMRNVSMRYSGGASISFSSGAGWTLQNAISEYAGDDCLYIFNAPNGLIEDSTFRFPIGSLADCMQLSGDGAVAEYSTGATLNRVYCDWGPAVGQTSVKHCCIFSNGGTLTTTVSDCFFKGGNSGFLNEASNMITTFQRSICYKQLPAGTNGSVSISSACDQLALQYLVLVGGKQGIQLAGNVNRSNMKLSHLTILDMAADGFRASGPCSGLFKNNIVDCPGVSGRCMTMPSVVGGQSWVENFNIVRPEQATYVSYLNVVYQTMAAYQTASGQGTSSTTLDAIIADRAFAGDITRRPTETHLQFLDRIRAHYVPVASGPGIRTGTPVAGVDDDQGATPDRGAVRWLREAKR